MPFVTCEIQGVSLSLRKTWLEMSADKSFFFFRVKVLCMFLPKVTSEMSFKTLQKSNGNAAVK